MGFKEKLIEAVQRCKEEENAFVRDLSDAERQAEGTFQDWSAKYLLGHITAWKNRQVNRLDQIRQGAQPQTVDDLEHENSSIYDSLRGKSFDEVLKNAEQTTNRLIEGIKAFSDEELTDRQRYSWLNGAALWRQIIGNGYLHPSIHLSEHYVKRGQPEKGLELQEHAAEWLAGLDSAPDWRGTLVYNLACYYAINGQREKALDTLRQSLEMNPGLTEFSKQDPDLKSLHDDPKYQALYEKA